MCTMQEKLQDILAKRSEERDDFKKTCMRIYKIRRFVDKIEALKNDSAWKLLIENSPQLQSEWESFLAWMKESRLAEKVRKVIDAELDENNEPILHDSLELIWNRLKRDFVRIGVMGTISSGKSSLLQALTGLDDNVIPTGADKCTATRTRFQHSDEKNATVYLRTNEQLMDIIVKHVELLNLYHIHNKGKELEQLQLTDDDKKSVDMVISRILANPSFIDAEKYDDVPISQGDKKDPTNAHAKGYCETLHDFVTNYEKYKHLLTGESLPPFGENRIKKGELKPYVSYVEDTPYCYAVEKVEVRFPLAGGDLNGIELVDTMGIGEAKVGVEEELTETLKKEVDIAIALYRVTSETYDNQTNSKVFHQRIKDCTKRDGDRKPEQWIYYLLNVDSSASYDSVNDYKVKIQKNLKPIILPETSWGDLAVMVDGANGQKIANEAEVNKYFINTVLGNLEKSIIDIDNTFMQDAIGDVQSIERTYHPIFESFSSLTMPKLNYDKYVDSRIDKKFLKASEIIEAKRFNETNEKKKHNDFMKHAMQQELEQCYPVKEYVKERFNNNQNIDNHDVEQYVKGHINGTKQNGRELEIFWKIREFIMDKMKGVLTSFKSNWFAVESEKRKNQVAATLYKDDTEFKNYISPLSGIAWLKKLAERIDDDDFTHFVESYDELKLECVDRIEKLFNDIYKDIILDVEFKYKNEEEASDQIVSQLSKIQLNFKKKIQETINVIFNEELDIFNQITSYFLNGLICNEDVSSPNAKKALVIFLRNNYKEIYKSDDFEKMSRAINDRELFLQELMRD